MKTPFAAFLALSFVCACGGGGSDATDDDLTQVDGGSDVDADDSKPDAGPKNVNCSLASQLSPVFTGVDASGNGYVANPVDIEVSATIAERKEMFFASNSAETVPLGVHQMEGQWLDANCTFCLFVNTVDVAAQEQHLWFPISGQIEITSVADNFVMTGTDLLFQHVNFVGNTLEVMPDDDGCTSLFTSFDINTPMQVGAGG